MNTFQAIVQKMPWSVLAASTAILVVASVYIVQLLFMLIEPTSLTVLLLLGLGLVGILGGYTIAKHSGYELAPKPRQIIGALCAGGAVAVMIYSALQLLAIGSSAIATVLLVAISILFFTEFILLRVAQAYSISLWQFGSLVLVACAVTLILSDLSEPQLTQIVMFMVAGMLTLLIGRAGHTYLLSPWVNSFWHGWSILFSGIAVMSLTTASGLLDVLITVAYMPLWIGLAVGVISVLMLILKQLKHKLLISKGYLQYKLQLLTALLLVLASILDINITVKFMTAFILIIVAYSLAEGRLVIKE